jgi:hypothetical protein
VTWKDEKGLIQNKNGSKEKTQELAKKKKKNPDGVTGSFHWHNRSGRLGSTQPLTEMSTRNLPWRGKGGRCVGLTTLPPSCADCLESLWASTSWNPKGLSRPVMGLLYLFFYLICVRARKLLVYRAITTKQMRSTMNRFLLTLFSSPPWSSREL